MEASDSTTAFVFGGGGARTAYQVGVLRYLAEAFPEADVAIVTGMGAGAVNASLLAGRAEAWSQAVDDMVVFWSRLRPDDVFRPRSLWDLITQLVRRAPSPEQSLLDPSPLRDQLVTHLPTTTEGILSGVEQNVEEGWLDAVAVSTTAYGSLETVLWTQGEERGMPHGHVSARPTTLTVDHILAAVSLALLYPAVSLDGEWHGAGVGLLDPIGPAIELGADRVLAFSSRSPRSGPSEPDHDPYPSPLQVASILSNTLLLDPLAPGASSAGGSLDRDAASAFPAAEGETPNEVLIMQPSVDLTGVAEELDVDVDATLGTVIRYLHGDGTRLPDLLSMLLFDPRYLHRLLLLGYEDARSEHDRLEQVLVR